MTAQDLKIKRIDITRISCAIGFSISTLCSLTLAVYLNSNPGSYSSPFTLIILAFMFWFFLGATISTILDIIQVQKFEQTTLREYNSMQHVVTREITGISLNDMKTVLVTYKNGNDAKTELITNFIIKKAKDPNFKNPILQYREIYNRDLGVVKEDVTLILTEQDIIKKLPTA